MNLMSIFEQKLVIYLILKAEIHLDSFINKMNHNSISLKTTVPDYMPTEL